MKSLKDFINSKEQTVVEEVIVQQEYLVVLDEPLFEGSARSHPADPPAVLIMKRKYIRQFPNNQRVAMYYVDKLDKYITVPYETSHWNNKGHIPTVEDVEDVMNFLKTIVENHSAKFLTFADGNSIKVEPQTANAILRLNSSLNEDNKKKFSDMSIKSKEHFSKVVDFANKHLD